MGVKELVRENAPSREALTPTEAPNEDKPAKPPGLTHTQAGKVLGVSSRRIVQLRKLGQLHGVQDERGVWRFSRESVRNLAIKRDSKEAVRSYRRQKDSTGIVAAEVFRLFAQGVGLPDVVTTLAISPTLVRELWVEYTTPLGRPFDKRRANDTIIGARVAARESELDDEESPRRGKAR